MSIKSLQSVVEGLVFSLEGGLASYEEVAVSDVSATSHQTFCRSELFQATFGKGTQIVYLVIHRGFFWCPNKRIKYKWENKFVYLFPHIFKTVVLYKYVNNNTNRDRWPISNILSPSFSVSQCNSGRRCTLGFMQCRYLGRQQ